MLQPFSSQPRLPFLGHMTWNVCIPAVWLRGCWAGGKNPYILQSCRIVDPALLWLVGWQQALNRFGNPKPETLTLNPKPFWSPPSCGVQGS